MSDENIPTEDTVQIAPRDDLRQLELPSGNTLVVDSDGERLEVRYWVQSGESSAPRAKRNFLLASEDQQVSESEVDESVGGDGDVGTDSDNGDDTDAK
jgi:hypothetical protein